METSTLTSAAFAAFFDHTLLRPTATVAEVETLCAEALAGGFAAVCVNGWHLPRVAARLAGSSVLPIAVIGFPLGAMRTAEKVAETRGLVEAGAKEIDMVLNLGAFLANDRATALKDIQAVVAAAGESAVKVIIETAYLSSEQITDATRLCIEAKAAFVKTSTGFASRGASTQDIGLMKEAIESIGASSLQIKASGGIRTLDMALSMINSGAHRIGSSNSHLLLQEFKIKYSR